MSLTEVATIQNQILKQAKYSTRATALIAGKSIGIGNGEIPGIHFGTSPSVSLDHAVAFSRNTGPQNSDIRDIPTLELSILRALNTRFLPTKLADPLDNLKSLLLDIPSRQYTIAVDYTRDS